MRIGVGYDSHRLVQGRPLVLGGVTVPHGTGLAGHSDADALCHAITDAVLGAAAAGDIGLHFPDSDDRWKDADSVALLRQAVAIVADAGYAVVNVDAVVIADAPRLAPHRDAIRARLAEALGVTVAAVSVKGKTNEGMGETGRGEGIAVHAVAFLTAR
jgi:2-C-methyl-D-erythritol 2,4-cyclodiphosphate synthase